MQEDRRELELDTITCGDCMEWLKTLPDGCADMVLTDPPYGTTNCVWDTKVDMVALFAELWRVLKHNGALLMFAQNPFAAEVIVQERKRFRYEWVWQKTRATGFANAAKMPLRSHELILCFYRSLPTFNACAVDNQHAHAYQKNDTGKRRWGNVYGKGKLNEKLQRSGKGERYPHDVVKAGSVNYPIHHTQKPQGLCEMLIQQYTHRGELVVDPFAGSGTTAAAARATGRRFLSCEMDAGYHAKAVERVAAVCPPLPGTEPLGVPELRRLAAANG